MTQPATLKERSSPVRIGSRRQSERSGNRLQPAAQRADGHTAGGRLARDCVRLADCGRVDGKREGTKRNGTGTESLEKVASRGWHGGGDGSGRRDAGNAWNTTRARHQMTPGPSASGCVRREAHITEADAAHKRLETCGRPQAAEYRICWRVDRWPRLTKLYRLLKCP